MRDAMILPQLLKREESTEDKSCSEILNNESLDLML
jgi:hypothetical protein